MPTRRVLDRSTRDRVAAVHDPGWDPVDLLAATSGPDTRRARDHRADETPLAEVAARLSVVLRSVC